MVSVTLGIAPFGLLSSCSNSKKPNDLKRLGIEPSTEDNLLLIDGLDYEVCVHGGIQLIMWIISVIIMIIQPLFQSIMIVPSFGV